MGEQKGDLGELFLGSFKMRRKRPSVQRGGGWRGKAAESLRESLPGRDQGGQRDGLHRLTYTPRRQLDARERPPLTMPRQADPHGCDSQGADSPAV